MNQLRQPFSELSPEVYKGLVQASIALEKSELGNALVELVYLRVSQINGCAFCLEKHSQALREHFTPRQISDLTFAVSLMNAFNRLAVAMRL